MRRRRDIFANDRPSNSHNSSGRCARRVASCEDDRADTLINGRTFARDNRWYVVTALALAVTVQTLLHGERLSDAGVALATQHYEKSSLLGMDVAQRTPSELDVTTDWLLSSARFRKRQMHRGTQVAALGSSNGAISSMGRAQETTTANNILTNSDSSTDHMLLNAEFETVYADFLAAFPCAKSCPLPKSKFQTFCNETMRRASESDFLKCISRGCGCYEGFEIREALFYTCELSKEQEHFDGADFATFVRGVVEDAEELCSQKLNVMTFSQKELRVDKPCVIKEKDWITPAHCAVQEEIESSCEFNSTSCGDAAEQVSGFALGEPVGFRWKCPVFKCISEKKCSWETGYCESKVRHMATTCKLTAPIKGKCVYCELGWRLDEGSNECIACEPGYNKEENSTGTFCVLDEEKLIAEVKKDLANMTAFMGDDLENLGLYLRQNAKLGAFWDDWKRELNKLTNQVVNIVNKIIRLKDDIANLIRDVRKAIIALGKDLWALAQKCAAVISDLLDSIIPGVDSLVGGVKDALVCDLSATAQVRLGESRLGDLAPRHDHKFERKLAEIFYGEELAKVMVPEPASSIGGNQCPVIPCLTAVCEEIRIEHTIDESTNGFSSPFPKKGSKIERRLTKISKQVKASIKVQVKGGMKTCAGLTDFSISFHFAKDIANAFIKVIKPAFEASAKTLTDWTNKLTDGIKAAKNWVAGAFNTVDRTVKNIPGFGRRRLLTSKNDQNVPYWDEELERAADFGRLENVYLSEVRELERSTRKQLEIIKAMHSGEDLYLAARRHHAAQQTSAELGGLMDGDKLISAMTDAFRAGMKAISFNLRFKVDMDASIEIDATADLYRTGDLSQGKFVKPFRKFKMLQYGFYIVVEGSLKLTLPYYFMANTQGHFEYELVSDGLYVDLGLSDGQARLKLPTSPKVKLMQQTTGQLSASMKLGVMAELEDFSITLCWAGLVCTGPVVQAGQPVYAGADVYAAAHSGHNKCFNGKSSLEAVFADRFAGYNDNQCRLRKDGAIAGAGWYSEFPGISFDLDLVTTTNLGSKCTLKLDLYEAPKFDYTAPISHHTCTSSGGEFISTQACDTTASVVDTNACPSGWFKSGGKCYEACYNTKTQCGNSVGRNGVYCAYKSPVCVRTNCVGKGTNKRGAKKC